MNGERSFAARRAPILLFILTSTWLLAAFLLRDGRAAGLFHDDGIYIAAGRSLAEGEGYRVSSLPGAPWQTKYPVLFPALLALVWKICPAFPDNVFAFQTLVALCGAGLLTLTYLVARRLLGLAENPALAVAGLLAASPSLLGLSRWVLTELPYAAAAIGALLLCEGTFARGRHGGVAPAALAGLAVAAGCMIKTQGLAMAVAVLLLLLAERRFREAAGFLAGWAPLPALGLGWQLAHSPADVSPLIDYYISYRSSTLQLATADGWHEAVTAATTAGAVVLHNLGTALTRFATFLALPESLPTEIRAALVAAVLGAGLVLAWRHGARMTVLYFLLFLASTLVMPWEPLRYLLPLLPLVLAFSALAFEGAIARAASFRRPEEATIRSRLRVARSLALATSLAAFGIVFGREALTYRPAALPGYLEWNGPLGEWQGFAETIDWLRDHTRPEDVLASPLDPFYYLQTGRRGVRYWHHNPQTYFYPWHTAPLIGTAAEIAPELRRLGVRWLIREPVLQNFYTESAAANELALELAALPVTGGELVFRSRDSGHFIYRLEWPETLESADRGATTEDPMGSPSPP